MAKFQITSPDGRKFEVTAPDGATQEQVLAYVQQQAAPKKAAAERYDPTDGMSGAEKFLAGTGKAFVDTARGLGQLVGLTSQEEVDAAKRLDAPLMDTGAGMAGNVAGNLATMVGPGAAVGAAGKIAAAPRVVNAARAALLPETIKGAAVSGAAMGGIQPVASDESRLLNMALGAAGGAAGNAIPRVAGAIVRPNVAPEVQALLDAKVPLTPGQILGGAAKAAEEKATSMPIVGDAIADAQRRALEGYNRAAYNRVLKPIGGKAGSAVGNEGVAATGDAVSKAYDDILPKLTLHLDRDLAQAVADTSQKIATELPKDRATQFNNVVDRYLLNRFKDGQMSGEAFKKAEANLSRVARDFTRSEADEVRQMGYALQDMNAAMREALERSNPGAAPVLRSINEAWANLVRVEGAAGRVGSKEGVFTPAALRGAVKGADRSVRHRSFARGEALMQDFADAGEKVLGGKYPDSGSIGRAAQIGAAAAAGANPGMLLGLLGGAGLYSRPGRKAAEVVLAKRPKGAATIAERLLEASPYLSLPGAGLLLSE